MSKETQDPANPKPSTKLALTDVANSNQLVAYADGQNAQLLRVLSDESLHGDDKLKAVSDYRQGLEDALAVLDRKERLQRFVEWYTVYRQSKKGDALRKLLEESDLFSMSDPTTLIGIIVYSSKIEIDEKKKTEIWDCMVGDKNGVMNESSLVKLFKNLRDYDLEDIKGTDLQRLLVRELVSFGLSSSELPKEAFDINHREEIYEDVPEIVEDHNPVMDDVSLEAYLENQTAEEDREASLDPQTPDEEDSTLPGIIRSSLKSPFPLNMHEEDFLGFSDPLKRVLETLAAADFTLYQEIIAEIGTELERAMHLRKPKPLLTLPESAEDFNTALMSILEKMGYTIKKEPQKKGVKVTEIRSVKMSTQELLRQANLLLEGAGDDDLAASENGEDPGETTITEDDSQELHREDEDPEEEDDF